MLVKTEVTDCRVEFLLDAACHAHNDRYVI